MTIEARKSSVIRKLELVNENWLLRSIEKLLSDVNVGKSSGEVVDLPRTDYSFYTGNEE